ncbi:MAG: hypothetical protein M0Q92_06575 [Methanoregula sp.]|jgi:hypothetical protein|nr:hypothetical protein [Methanoregula sp.]
MVDITYYQKIFKQTPPALLLVDKQHNNIGTNTEFSRMTVVSRDTILFKKITDFKDRLVIPVDDAAWRILLPLAMSLSGIDGLLIATPASGLENNR